tara:strand:- start:523 stop:729 length:207 start_codon:yes stop_codon:yes gene_type:complete
MKWLTIVILAVGISLVPFASACGFVDPESIENRGTDYYKDRYDSSNWTMPENIYNPDNYEACLTLGWC